MASRGHQHNIGIAFESVWGVAEAAPTLWVPGICTLRRTEEKIGEKRPIQNVDVTHFGSGKVEVKGGIEIGMYSGMWSAAANALSEACVTRSTIRGRNDELRSMTVWKQLETGTFVYTGVKVNKAEFKCSAGEELVLSLDCIGKDGVKDSNHPPDFSGLGTKYMFNQCIVALAGFSDTNLESATVGVENNLHDDGHRIASTGTIYQLYAGARDVKVELDRDFVDTTLWDLFRAGTAVAFSWQFAAGGKALTISCPRLIIPEADLDTTDRTGRGVEPIVGDGYGSADQGTQAISILEA